MKTDFIFIDDTLNNNKTFLCFLLLLLGTIIGCYNQEYVYNEFFLNIYNIFTSFYYWISIILALLVNNLNIINDLFSKIFISLRIPKQKRNNFYKKELVLSNLLICTIAFILVIAFSILFSKNNYNFFGEMNYLKLYIIDILFAIFFLILSAFSGLFLLVLTTLLHKNLSIVIFLLLYNIIAYVIFILEFSVFRILSMLILLLFIYIIFDKIEKRQAN